MGERKISRSEPHDLSPEEDAMHERQVVEAEEEYARRLREKAGRGGALLLVPLTAEQAASIKRAADAVGIPYETYIATSAHRAALAALASTDSPGRTARRR